MPASETLAAIRQHSGWFIALGVVQILVGMLAIGSPYIATLASAVFLGWLLIVAGVFQGVQAFRARAWQGFLLHFLGAALYLVAGVLVVTRPAAGALTLTLILAIFLTVEGVSRAVLAFRLRDHPGWAGLLVGGVLGAILGVMIWLKWPSSGLWALGLLIGVNLIFNGFCLIAIASAAKRSDQPQPA